MGITATGRTDPLRTITTSKAGSGQFEIRFDSLQLAPFEYDHLFYGPRDSHGERLAVGRYLISDQGDVLVPFLSDECKNV
jgi:hypothetical protein